MTTQVMKANSAIQKAVKTQEELELQQVQLLWALFIVGLACWVGARI